MGNRDSSKTRVQPVLGRLLRQDRTGKTWLPALLNCVEGSDFAAVLAKSAGPLLPGCADTCFERPVPPPERFLLWLIHNVNAHSWPTTGSHGQPRTYGSETQEWRTKLTSSAPDEVAAGRAEATRLLARHGVNGSEGRWWAFEGPTYVDCLLETDDPLLLIEGKRTERLSAATQWHAARNQLWRNVEALGAAAGGKRYAVLLIAEQHEDVGPTLAASLPHLAEYERPALQQHYLGCVLWPDVCAATGIDYQDLPDTTDELTAA